MSLVFDNHGFDSREFPDLVAKGFRITSAETFAAPSTRFWKQFNHFSTTFDGDKFTNHPPMPLLPTTIFRLLGFWLWSRSGMMVLCRGRDR